MKKEIRLDSFSNFFYKLKSFGISYVILNPPDKFDKICISASDSLVLDELDVWIEDLSKFEAFLYKNNIKIVQKIWQGYKNIRYFLFYKNKILDLDIYEEWVLSCRKILDKSFFRSSVGRASVGGEKKSIDALNFLEEVDLLVFSLIKASTKGEIPLWLKDRLKLITQVQWEFLARRIKQLLGLSLDLDHKNILNDDAQYLWQFIHKVRKSIFSITKIRVGYLLIEIVRIINRIVYPTGRFAVLVGVDGVGKSSLLSAIKKERLPFRQVVFFHLTPFTVLEETSLKTKKGMLPYQKKLYGRFFSYLKIFYLFCQYWIGFWFMVYPLLVKSSLVIFDRYYYDLCVDPDRFRVSKGRTLACKLAYFVPKPDLVIFLQGSAEVIRSRKEELALQRIECLQNRWENLFRTLPLLKVVKLNADKKLKSLVIDLQFSLLELDVDAIT